MIRPTGVLDEHEAPPEEKQQMAYLSSGTEQKGDRPAEAPQQGYKIEIVWTNVLFIGGLHVLALAGLVAGLWAKWATLAFTFGCIVVSGLGSTAGAHRYWAHKAFKAKLPLHLFLLFAQTMCMLLFLLLSPRKGSAYTWARDHRLHHKYSETDADPKNAHRGMFFSHTGWLLCKKLPAVVEKGRTIDNGDLQGDPWVRFQHTFWLPLALVIGLALPTWIPWRFWGEDPLVAFLICGALRYALVANGSWSVNSLAHRYGMKPYDRHIGPVDSTLVQALTAGEGWHNFHHTFPWDYRSSELGLTRLNLTTRFIELMASIGQAYDLKTANPATVRARIARTGDGSHAIFVAPHLESRKKMA